jgi:hypothetical protein
MESPRTDSTYFSELLFARVLIICSVLVWHDEFIDPTKCEDTKPVTQNDPLFPYVGKVRHPPMHRSLLTEAVSPVCGKPHARANQDAGLWL